MAKKEKANGMAILNEQINKKEFSRVYLLGGTEPYLIYQYRDKLIAAMIDPNDTMNFITYKGENSKPEDIIEFADTMPFFTERRVVLVENSNFFKNGCEKLEEALDGLPDTTVLIFVEKNIDNRKKLSKLVAQLGTVAMFDAPDSEMLAVWLNGMFVEDQIAISGATLRYLIDRVGTSMNLLKNEADKLRSYAVEKGSVSKEDIDLLCVNQVEDKIFDMIDAISEKKQQKAMELYDDLLYLQEAPMKILVLITRNFMQLLKIRFALDTGTPEGQIASAFGIRPYFVKKYIAQARSFSKDQLLSCVRLCQEADANIKTGKMRDKLATEMVILELLLHGGEKQEVEYNRYKKLHAYKLSVELLRCRRYLLRTHIKQVFPSAVNLFLILYKQVLVFWLEQMLESSLWTKEVFDWKLLLWLIIQDPLAFHNLEQWPVTCLHCELADLHDIGCVITPATRTW